MFCFQVKVTDGPMQILFIYFDTGLSFGLPCRQISCNWAPNSRQVGRLKIEKRALYFSMKFKTSMLPSILAVQTIVPMVVRVHLALAPMNPTNFGMTKFLALDLAALVLPTRTRRKSALPPTERSRLTIFLEPNQVAAQCHGRTNYLVRLPLARN